MSLSYADRNLIFGILARQREIISREALRGALAVWIAAKQRPLSEILRQQGALSVSQSDSLKALADTHISKHNHVPQQAFGSLNAGILGALREDLISLGAVELAASVAAFAAQAEPDPNATQAFLEGAPRPETRYHVLRSLGQGGMGKVWVALDNELHREVAFKHLLPKYAEDPDFQERLKLEAEITGNLEHPGIVPVYSLGSYGDGQPFYAMRLIPGDSLKEAIDLFHEKDETAGRKPAERNLELRSLLGRFMDACHAIQYAHSRKVLHRDLKPANIVLGNYGDTLVVDWGLAKAMSTKNSQPAHSELPVDPIAGRELVGTEMGAQGAGTPEYMSPEQMSGRLDLLDERSDVYSLGATLYHLLTGRPPFAGENRDEVRRKVERGEFKAPHIVSKSVPRPLSEICLKAMARHPKDRYSSALQLVSDIEHWQADEAVLAYEEDWRGPLARWLRKRAAGVAISAVALLLLTIVAVVAAVMIFGEKQIADQQTRLAERHLYASRMNNSQASFETNQVGETVRLLKLVKNEISSNSPLGFEWHYWDRLCHQELHELVGHTDQVAAVAFSRDGMQLVSGSVNKDKTVRLWDVATESSIRIFIGHKGHVWGVAISPDGKRLASASEDKTARIWEASTGKELYSLPHDGIVNSVAFSPDGQWLASASHDKTVKIWEVESGTLLRTLSKHTAPIETVAFSPDGLLLASASHDTTVKVWHADTGEESQTLRGHTDKVWSVAFSPDGKRLASASVDRTVKVWDLGEKQSFHTLIGHTRNVVSVAFSPDGSRIASASHDQTIKVWDSDTGEELRTIKGHTAEVNSLAFNRQGHLASASHDHTVKIWDLDREPEPRTLSGHTSKVGSVAFGGGRIVSGSDDATVKVWDAATHKNLLTITRHADIVTRVAFSSDSKLLASASRDTTARVWDTETGKELLTFNSHKSAVNCIAFSPDPAIPGQVASGSADGKIFLWEAATGRVLLTLSGHAGGITNLAFSRDGKRLASTSDDKTVKIWNSVSGQELLTLTGHSLSVSGVAFSPNGTRIASASHDKTVRLWDATTGQKLFLIMGHTELVNCVAFSPDGKRLATASADKTAKIWDAETGQMLLNLKGHIQDVTSVAFSTDGNQVATAGNDRKIEIWDATPRATKPGAK